MLPITAVTRTVYFAVVNDLVCEPKPCRDRPEWGNSGSDRNVGASAIPTRYAGRTASLPATLVAAVGGRLCSSPARPSCPSTENLTITGSVARIIVVERARPDLHNGFREYFRLIVLTLTRA